MRTGVAAMVIAIAGCGDNAVPVELDVEVEGDATVALIAYRDGDGPWRVPRVASSTGSDTFYVLEVATEYEAQVVCVGADGFTINTVYGMREDTSPAIGCFYESTTAPVATFPVTGEMLQPGQVFMDSQDLRYTSSTTAPWSFALQVPQGIHDLVAVPNPSSPVQTVVIRRGEDIEGPVAAPTIDLAAEGLPLVRVPVTVSGAGGDFGSVWTELETEHGDGALPTTNGVEVLPMSSMMPGDSQTFRVDVSSLGGPPLLFRNAFAFIDEHSQFVAQLYPRLDGVTATAYKVDVLAATWSNLPTDDYDWLGINFGVDAAHYPMAASRAWLDAHPPSLVTHMTAPDFDTSWIPSTVPDGYCLWLDANREGVSYSTSVCN